MDDAVFVLDLAPRDDLVGMHDDADEAVVASRARAASTGRQAWAAIATAISSVTTEAAARR